MVDIFEVLLLIGVVFAVVALMLPGPQEARRPRWNTVGQIHHAGAARRRLPRRMVYDRPMRVAMSRPIPVAPITPAPAPAPAVPAPAPLVADGVIPKQLSPARR